MDVARKKKPITQYKSRLAVLGFIIVAVLCLLLTNDEHKVTLKEVTMSKVEKGNLHVIVSGYGVLKSYKQKLLTAYSSATVEEILLRPGITVEPDTILLQMSNPDLEREVENARLLVAQEEAELRKILLNNKRQQLDENAQVNLLRSDFEKLELKVNAEKQLIDSGVISKLTYETAKLELARLSEAQHIQEQRLAHLLMVGDEAKSIQQERIKQFKIAYNISKSRLDRLAVRAGTKGVLQRLPVELGQSVQPGQELALIGSLDDLTGLIKVPQSRIQNIKIGQPASISLRNKQYTASVARITPEVQNGTVEIELKIESPLPISVRPEMSIEANITTKTIEDTLYVKRPIGIKSFSNSKFFKLSKDGDKVQTVEVQTGAESDKYLQILRGLNRDDIVVISDTTEFKSSSEVSLAQ